MSRRKKRIKGTTVNVKIINANRDEGRVKNKLSQLIETKNLGGTRPQSEKKKEGYDRRRILGKTGEDVDR